MKVGLPGAVTEVYCAWCMLRKHHFSPKVLKGVYVNDFQHYVYLIGEQYFGQEGHIKRRNVCRPRCTQYVVYFLLCIVDSDTVVRGASDEAIKMI